MKAKSNPRSNRLIACRNYQFYKGQESLCDCMNFIKFQGTKKLVNFPQCGTAQFPLQLQRNYLDLHAVRAPDAFVIVFTIDDRSTFERATDLLYELRKMDDWTGPVILVANKCDLVRTKEMSTEEAKSVATTYDCKYIETSVVLNHNVDELLVGVVSQIRLNAQQTIGTGTSAQGANYDGSSSTGSAKESSCYGRSKHLLNKIFRKDHLSKSCENLNVKFPQLMLESVKSVEATFSYIRGVSYLMFLIPAGLGADNRARTCHIKSLWLIRQCPLSQGHQQPLHDDGRRIKPLKCLQFWELIENS
ncbi:GTP-binding protein rad [Plakobranchus ocellatus]|uniref:GTP-binding protein rad n=1 Tax=Plakobranchus ocellatus TaxID=259542 RepID=A0AAV4C819_9GAST|nr:GTP-binding protein rad [Plakobranchus ocellatus]